MFRPGRASKDAAVLHAAGLVSASYVTVDDHRVRDAGQFRVGSHALCWVHAGRPLQKLMPPTPQHPSKLFAILSGVCTGPSTRGNSVLPLV